MRKIVSAILSITMLVGMLMIGSGCAKTENRKIAMITDYTTVEEDRFYATIWESVQAVAKEYDIECNAYYTGDETDHSRKETIDQVIADGATLVVLPSSTFAEPLADAQKKYPDVKFFAIDIGDNELAELLTDNAYTCAFKEEEAGFLAGYSAVYEGYTGLGFLGGVEMPSITRFGYGYIQGADKAAQQLEKNINIKYTYGGQFYGSVAITEQMQEWYSSGTEVVFACGGAIYTSVVEVALESEGMVIGVDVDQREDGLKYSYNPFLTSAVKGLTEITTEIVTTYAEGNWSEVGGKTHHLGLEEGNYVGLPTGEAVWEFKNFTHSRYNDVCSKIKSGEWKVSSDITKLPEVSEFTSITVE